MGKTIRKSRDDVKYKEGRHDGLRVYKCRCEACTNPKFKNKKAVTVREDLSLE